MKYTSSEVAQRFGDRLHLLLNDRTLTSVERDSYPDALLGLGNREPILPGNKLSMRNTASLERQKKL